MVVTGAALGLPGSEHVFDDANVGRILDGEQFLGPIPAEVREAMVRKNIIRLVKNERGEGRFETIDDVSEVIKLAARRRQFDLHEEYGYPADRLLALDITSQLAIGAGLDALRDAGLPLVMQYRTTTTGTLLPDRWLLPEALRDDTGVIFASAFPGIDSFADESRRHYRDQARRERLVELEELRARCRRATASWPPTSIDGWPPGAPSWQQTATPSIAASSSACWPWATPSSPS